VIAWAKLESAMQDTLWNLLGLKIEDGRILTARMDALYLIDALRKLAPRQIDDQQRLGEFLDTLTKMDDRREDRNFIVHGSWGMFGNPQHPQLGLEPIAMSLRQKVPDPTELLSETFPADRMYSIIRDIVLATKFFTKFLSERDPSFDKSRLGHLEI